MNVDTIVAFEALQHYGIRVARTHYVDSVESAIAFAERRDARDPRAVPIVLRAPSTGAVEGRALVEEHPLKSETAIRRAYDRIVRTARVSRIVAQAATAPGTDVVISGTTDVDLGKKVIALQSAVHSVQRMIPLDDAAIEVLANNFEGYHHRLSRERSRRMLEHLLKKVSAFFEAMPVTAFRLVVRLHENEYTVVDAAMTSSEPLHFTRRLDSRAHDRKGDDYHPAGRQ